MRAVIAESYERIHRSNLVGMGVLPLEFVTGENRQSAGLTGRELLHDRRPGAGVKPRQRLKVRAEEGGRTREFVMVARIDTPEERRVSALRRHPALRAARAAGRLTGGARRPPTALPSRHRRRSARRAARSPTPSRDR